MYDINRNNNNDENYDEENINRRESSHWLVIFVRNNKNFRFKGNINAWKLGFRNTAFFSYM